MPVNGVRSHDPAEYRVLIVDDSPEDRELYRRILKGDPEARFVFDEAELGEEALRLCDLNPPDCILLEYRLPDLDGLEFLRSLETHSGGSLIPPVVMLTRHGSETIAVQAMKQGVQDYLIKGAITPNGLRAAVRNAIEKSSLRPRIKEQRRELEELAQERARLIDGLEKQNQALAEATRRKDEFLVMLAHELRNPLAPIRNAMQVLKHTSTESEIVQQAHDILDRQTAHMARLIDDLLDISRISRGKILLRKEAVDLVGLVRLAVEDRRRALEDRGLQVSLTLPEKPLWMMGDATRLAQMIGNLLHNAGKFTHRGGQISVSLRADPASDMAVLSIRDTGIGIEPELLRQVFEPFTQGKDPWGNNQGGLGLGLALVKALAELHDGKVSATSGGHGLGSEFTIRFPLMDRIMPVRKESGRRDQGSMRSLRILVVEDQPDSAESMKVLLQLCGHEVEVACTGPAALDALVPFHPEVVLCDISLPGGMSGYDVANALRENPISASAYLIALTGYGRDEDRRRAREAGFDVHLTKPVDFNRLEGILAQLGKRATCLS